MSNIDRTIDDDSRRFIEDFAAMHVPWGMPTPTGRLYAFLMLSPAPVSLDDMVAALDIAKSSASVIARALETAGLVRRYGETGSKRVRYAAAEDAAGMFAAKTTLLTAVVRMLDTQAPASAPPAVRKRLDGYARFYERMRASMDRMLRDADGGSDAGAR